MHEQYGIKYSRSGMTDWLIQHGFAYKRPKKIPGKLDPEKQRIFIEQYYETSVTFFQAIRGFFLEEIPKITDILKCRINDKFQVVDLNPIKLAV
ncbi:Winged helix-turn helix [Candidatus Rhabdochlamydia oedothoracis]|uniref:Winged helix-turn helix n=1 Tax=Candidatus Rhabdochlamydia oedothoracis TaxID=2720720 RepID=A0ABX8V127_9BACT|nr:Winged helix-turn helix [Candidatus Rhabdochlamydia oedothoracis]